MMFRYDTNAQSNVTVENVHHPLPGRGSRQRMHGREESQRERERGRERGKGERGVRLVVGCNTSVFWVKLKTIGPNEAWRTNTNRS